MLAIHRVRLSKQARTINPHQYYPRPDREYHLLTRQQGERVKNYTARFCRQGGFTLRVDTHQGGFSPWVDSNPSEIIPA